MSKPKADIPFSPRRLRVLAEYETSGILLIEDSICTAILEHDELKLPAELSNRFVKWIGWYSRQLVDDPWDRDGFNAMGRSISKELKAFVGPDVIVEFYAEPHVGRQPEIMD